MQFNSSEFLIFFCIFLILWRFSYKSKWTLLLISVASTIFYFKGVGWLIAFLILSTCVDYFCGRKLESGTYKNFWLCLSLFTNLGILTYFKYFFKGDFPIGISFYTFQSLSYTLDKYRGDKTRPKNILHYYSFVSFFPQLIAGPICRSKNLLNQLLDKNLQQNYLAGSELIILGFFKKVFLADQFAAYLNPVISNKLVLLDFTHSWLLLVSYGWQIYFDFSGYTDIARGIAKLLGISIPENFISPYSSISLTQFWRRWHITLSTWFRDYVYIPLGGTKKRQLINVLITMTLSGAWHGGSINYILWGLYHGILLILEKIIGLDLKENSNIITNILGKIRTYLLVTVGWAFFRFESSNDLLLILKKLFFYSNNPSTPIEFFQLKVLILISFIFEFFLIKHDKIKNNVIFLTILLIFALFFRPMAQEFIYYRF